MTEQIYRIRVYDKGDSEVKQTLLFDTPEDLLCAVQAYTGDDSFYVLKFDIATVDFTPVELVV